MTTISQFALRLRKILTIVDGFSRRIETVHMLSIYPNPIPSSIKKIIAEYYNRETDFEWNYSTNDEEIPINKNNKVFNISNNGLTITTLGKVFGSIMFGDWCSTIENSNFSVHINTSELQNGQFGFGFCTPEFSEWTIKKFNPGHNHSTTINMDGWFKESKEFQHKYKHKNTVQELVSWVKSGDILAINVDMIERCGRMWSYTKQESYVDHPQLVEVCFAAGVEKVGIICYTGTPIQSLTIIRQFYS